MAAPLEPAPPVMYMFTPFNYCPFGLCHGTQSAGKILSHTQPHLFLVALGRAMSGGAVRQPS